MVQIGRWPRWRLVRDFAIGGWIALVVVSSAVNIATFLSDRAAPAVSDQSAGMQAPVAAATTAVQSGLATERASEPVAGVSTAQATGTGPLAVAPSEQIYVVQAGDTLYKIAAAYDTTILAIVEENGISDPDRLQVGQVLTIPGASP